MNLRIWRYFSVTLYNLYCASYAFYNLNPILKQFLVRGPDKIFRRALLRHLTGNSVTLSNFIESKNLEKMNSTDVPLVVEIYYETNSTSFNTGTNNIYEETYKQGNTKFYVTQNKLFCIIYKCETSRVWHFFTVSVFFFS